jgi:large subunit ribosomal protein L30e
LITLPHSSLLSFSKLEQKKSSADSINSRLTLVVKSGKYSLGLKSTLRALRDGKALVVLIADNCPQLEKSQLEYFALLAKTPVHSFAGNNNNLGTACGKLFGVSVMTILDAGDADLSAFNAQ